MLKKIILCLFLFSSVLSAQQQYTVSGIVMDENGQPCPLVFIFMSQSKKGTITNTNGEFSLTIKNNEDVLTVSHIGYETFLAKVTPQTNKFQIRLKQVPIQLSEVVVNSLSATELLKHAIKKIPDNYKLDPFLTKAYYRAKASENDTLLYMEEAAFDIVKSYQPGFRDRYFLVKNRNFRFTPDKTHWHGIGQYDFVSNASELFNNRFFQNRTINYLPSTTFDDRMVYVLSVSSKKETEKFEGKIYIDVDDLAFIRFEMKGEDGSERSAQYKKIEGKYYLMSGHSVYLNKNIGMAIRPAETNMITTDIIHSFSKEHIEGAPVRADDILEAYAINEDDTSFWEEHNALLPDSAIRTAISAYNRKQREIPIHVANSGDNHAKRLYTPNLSLNISSDLMKDFSTSNHNSISIGHLVNFFLFKEIRGHIWKPLLASCAYYMLSAPFEEVLHENQLLHINGLKAKINPFLFNQYQSSYPYGMDEDVVAKFKETNHLDFMRLHIIRNDGHYAKSLLLEEELAKVNLSDKNNLYDFYRYYFLLSVYHRGANIYSPFKKDVKRHDLPEEKQPLIIDKNRSWVKSLFEPEADYRRHIMQDHLTNEEQAYLKRSAWFSLFNLVSPQMFGIKKFHIKNDGFTFSLNYLRVPFGEMFGQNIWLMHNNKQLHGIFLKQYKTFDRTTFGAGYKLYDFKLFHKMYVSSTLDAWHQPAGLQFKDQSFKIGFHIGQMYEYQLLSDKYSNKNNLSAFLGFDFKTKGYMPQSYFLEKHFDVKVGFNWYF
jgi:hypothetical protein